MSIWRYANPAEFMWLRAAGVDGVDPERGPRFTVENMAIEAAIAGQGVALVSGALVAGDIRAGRLVRPFPRSVREATAFCYYLVYPEVKAAEPRVSLPSCGA
jgi:LysR family glycine cleavage system transcriptional activator